MGEQISDHDLLVRIDERTAQHGKAIEDIGKTMTACATTIQDHAERLSTVEGKINGNGNGNGKAGFFLTLFKQNAWAAVAALGVILLFILLKGTNAGALLGMQ